MPSQASSLLSAKLRCYFSGLPSHFETDFCEFSALPGHLNHAFRSTGSTFLTFSLFSLHIASSSSLRASFCRFSGPLGTSRRAPGPTFSGQKGEPKRVGEAKALVGWPYVESILLDDFYQMQIPNQENTPFANCTCSRFQEGPIFTPK